MKLFLKLFVLVFLLDIAIGFSLSYFTGSGQPGLLVLVIDEIISFPIALWNRLVPAYGIYRATSNAFWSVIIFNALVQALVVFGFVKVVRKVR